MLCPIRVKRLTAEIAAAREDYEVCDFKVTVRHEVLAKVLEVHIHEGIKHITYCTVPVSGDSKQRRQQLRKAIRQVEEIIHGTR